MHTIDDIIKIYTLDKCNLVYHYTDARALQSIIESNELWATKSDFLNDKNEFIYTYELVDGEILSQVKNDSVRERIRNAFWKEVQSDWMEFSYKGQLSGQYILSFSMNKDNLVLWSEFSNLMGYNLAFECEELRRSVEVETPHYLDGMVIYDRGEQIECLKGSLGKVLELRPDVYRGRTFGALLKDISDEELRYLVLDISVAFIGYAAFFKRKQFEAEEEYRFLFFGVHKNPIHKRKTDPIYFRQKNDMILPYMKIAIDTKTSLKYITTGPKNSFDIAQKGIEHLCRYYDLDVEIRSSKIPFQR